MDTVWWILTLLLMAVGLVGTLIPYVPGTAIIFAAAVLHCLVMGEEQSVSYGLLGILLLLLIIAQVLDLVSSAIGAKFFGATRWGAIGCIIGAIVGLFFGLPGILLGPILGALIGELLGGKEILPSLRSAWGSLLGVAGGIGAKLVIGVIMIILFLTGKNA